MCVLKLELLEDFQIYLFLKKFSAIHMVTLDAVFWHSFAVKKCLKKPLATSDIPFLFHAQMNSEPSMFT